MASGCNGSDLSAANYQCSIVSMYIISVIAIINLMNSSENSFQLQSFGYVRRILIGNLTTLLN